MPTSAVNRHACLQEFQVGGVKAGSFYSLPALDGMCTGNISRLPFSLRVVLESILRHLDGVVVTDEDLRALIDWNPKRGQRREIPFNVARIVAPDSSGVPLLADLAAMREAAVRLGIGDAAAIEPSVAVDLVIDHSLAVDQAGSPHALEFNMRAEYERNAERYSFLKWAASAFRTIKVFPPGTGIVHQVNLEHLARGVVSSAGVVHFDSLVGTDSHTTMINGIGVLGWGVGGIEAEAAMLGQPIYLQIPEVVGVHLVGSPPPGITGTDIALTVVELLRREKVVASFVEFFGPGATVLAVPDRATIANMAPEYGATAAFFPVDAGTIDYLRTLGRSAYELAALRAYCEAQNMYGMPALGQIDYSRTVELDLGGIVPSLAGPSRPQERVSLQSLGAMSAKLFGAPIPETAHGASDSGLHHGDIVIAAITSCTNTSNPAVMLSAGLVAKKAHARGLRPAAHVKTSLTPGSRVVSAYLAAAGLMPALDAMGFHAVGYGCATCMGNSGPLDAAVFDQIERRQLVVAAVLSGNRNFEARIHQAVRANFLMSPPLVVIFSIVGTLCFDPARDPVGFDRDGGPVFFEDLWPTPEELQAVMPFAQDARHVIEIYDVGRPQDPMWTSLKGQSGSLFDWDPASSYIKRPPFFDDFTLKVPHARPIKGARALAVLGDSVTTDHINPGSAIPSQSDAGRYLSGLGVAQSDFNSYISRRANDEVMVRSIFAHVRLRNLLVPGSQGSVTVVQPGGAKATIFEAARAYAVQGVATLVFAGEEYGTGSSRDWAAKGTRLLGIRAVIAKSFERIHRSNLIGMGVLPCEFLPGQSVASLGLDGTETFDLIGAQTDLAPGKFLSLHIHRADGTTDTVELKSRIDTVVEQRNYEHGGILPFVLRGRLTQRLNERSLSHTGH